MIPEIMEIIVKVISKERDRAREVVEALIDSEQTYLFTNNAKYKENQSDIMISETQIQGGQPGQNGMIPQGNP